MDESTRILKEFVDNVFMNYEHRERWEKEYKGHYNRLKGSTGHKEDKHELNKLVHRIGDPLLE